MEPKKIAKKLEQVVEKFTTVSVGYDNGFNTEDQVKKRAAASIATLTTLSEVHNVGVSDIIDEFKSLLRLEFSGDGKEAYDGQVNLICSRLYDMISANQE